MVPTLTKQVLQILWAHRVHPMPIRGFVEQTGVPAEKVERALRDCVRQRWMLFRNGAYELTLEGAVRAKRQPKTDAHRLELKAARLARNKAAALEAKSAKRVDSVVAVALATQHPLAGVWA